MQYLITQEELDGIIGRPKVTKAQFDLWDKNVENECTMFVNKLTNHLAPTSNFQELKDIVSHFVRSVKHIHLTITEVKPNE